MHRIAIENYITDARFLQNALRADVQEKRMNNGFPHSNGNSMRELKSERLMALINYTVVTRLIIQRKILETCLFYFIPRY